MKKKNIIKIIVLVGILLIISTISSFNHKKDIAGVSIEDYVKQNISTLSPNKEVLGGKFYVINIKAKDGFGTVVYEDGHIGHIAEFTYEIDEKERPIIKTFTVTK